MVVCNPFLGVNTDDHCDGGTFSVNENAGARNKRPGERAPAVNRRVQAQAAPDEEARMRRGRADFIYIYLYVYAIIYG